MRILNLRRIRGAGTLVAVFDLEASAAFTIVDWQLRQTPKGLRAYPPSPRNGRPAVRVEPNSFSEIGRLAAEAFSNEGNAHEHNHAA